MISEDLQFSEKMFISPATIENETSAFSPVSSSVATRVRRLVPASQSHMMYQVMRHEECCVADLLGCSLAQTLSMTAQ